MADDELPNFDIISSLGLQAPESEAKNSGKKNEVANNKRRFRLWHMAISYSNFEIMRSLDPC